MTTLAHGGGVPETLSVLVPIALTVILLRKGAKKAKEREEDDDSAAD